MVWLPEIQMAQYPWHNKRSKYESQVGTHNISTIYIQVTIYMKGCLHSVETILKISNDLSNRFILNKSSF